MQFNVTFFLSSSISSFPVQGNSFLDVTILSVIFILICVHISLLSWHTGVSLQIGEGKEEDVGQGESGGDT